MATAKPAREVNTANVNQIPIAIIGATGYTGMELVRLLSFHPGVSIVALTSRQQAGEKYGILNHTLEELDVPKIAKKVKGVFLCLPHHEAMNTAQEFRSWGVKVIDLSADFRLKKVETYEKWYGKHTQKKLIQEAVYGLPELHRAEIASAKLVAAPGCYATTNILALTPLLAEKMILPHDIISDSKSGVTGAGRSAQVDSLFSEVNDSFKAYKIASHRHTPEMEQELSIVAGEEVTLLFSPHLVPMDRGILSTIYARPTRKWTTAQLLKAYKKFYKNEKFIKILPEGSWPATKQVRGTNNCLISVLYDARTERIVITAALDNLTKGASGQAVQCFNLMFGFAEEMALTQTALIP